ATDRQSNGKGADRTIRALFHARKNGRLARSGESGEPRSVGVEPLAHFLAGLEVRHPLRRDVHRIAGTRVASDARVTQTGGERAEAAQFDAPALGQTRGDLVEEN